MTPINLKVNGKEVNRDVPGETRLSDVLRERLT